MLRRWAGHWEHTLHHGRERFSSFWFFGGVGVGSSRAAAPQAEKAFRDPVPVVVGVPIKGSKFEGGPETGSTRLFVRCDQWKSGKWTGERSVESAVSGERSVCPHERARAAHHESTEQKGQSKRDRHLRTLQWKRAALRSVPRSVCPQCHPPVPLCGNRRVI